MQQATLPGFDAPARELHNLFFALWPDEATRAGIAEIAARMQKNHPVPGHWLKPARYHLTLQFLGEHARLPADLVASACAAAARVRSPAFDLALDRVGSFANARVCWLGCTQLPPQMLALFEQLGVLLAANGCRVVGGRQLVPHVTLLRDAEHELAFALSSALRWRVDEFVLIHSQIQPFLPYRIVERWPLRQEPI
jgi:2'-5' RNA ligase